MERPTVRWLQDPAQQVRAARILWLAFAIVVWNVVFDRVIVLAGREYVYTATLAARNGVYLLASDWMDSAVSRGFWLASAGTAVILAAGLGLISWATSNNREPQA